MQIKIDDKWCKGCEICMKVCPKNVLTLSDKRSKRGYLMPEASNIENCIGCKLCQNICPDLCLSVEE